MHGTVESECTSRLSNVLVSTGKNDGNEAHLVVALKSGVAALVGFAVRIVTNIAEAPNHVFINVWDAVQRVVSELVSGSTPPKNTDVLEVVEAAV